MWFERRFVLASLVDDAHAPRARRTGSRLCPMCKQSVQEPTPATGASGRSDGVDDDANVRRNDNNVTSGGNNVNGSSSGGSSVVDSSVVGSNSGSNVVIYSSSGDSTSDARHLALHVGDDDDDDEHVDEYSISASNADESSRSEFDSAIE